MNSYPIRKLGDVANITTGKLDSNQAKVGGIYPFFTCSPITLAIDTYSFDCDAVLLAGNNANGIFPVKYYDGKFNAYQRTYVITPKDKNNLDTKFLYYQIRLLAELLGARSLGTATKFLTLTLLNPLELLFPPLPIQRRIGEILGRLDDKIELNRRATATLEAMAQALYKHWFVEFGPFQAGNFVESELGLIPEGWGVGRLGDMMVNYDRKRIPLSSRVRANRQGPFPYYGAASIVDYVDDYLFDGIHLLMAEDGTVKTDKGNPVLQYVWGKFWVNNHAHILVGANGFSTEFLKLSLNDVNVEPYITGAVQPKISQANLNGIPMLLPESNTLAVFDSIIKPYFAKLRQASDESIALAATRDYLLPKLLSGEIGVEAAAELAKQHE